MQDSSNALLAVLALLMPIWLPTAVLGLTSRLSFWWKSGAIILAGAASLPLGVALRLIAEDPGFFIADHPNIGAGMTAVPVLLLWVLSFTVTIIWIIVLAAKNVWSRLTPKTG